MRVCVDFRQDFGYQWPVEQFRAPIGGGLVSGLREGPQRTVRRGGDGSAPVSGRAPGSSVGDRGFEPLTSSVSGKRSPPELITRITVQAAYQTTGS